MPGISNYLSQKLLDHSLRTAAFTMPAACYVGLYTTATDPAAGGTEVLPGTNTYARQLAGAFALAVNGVTTNNAAITWANMPAVTVTHMAIHDALTGGNRLFYGQFLFPTQVVAGTPYVIAIGDLDVVLN